VPEIQLEQTWSLGARIDGGGFGDVYEAHSAAVASAVIKLIPKDPGAQRELLFADLSGVRKVVPVIDQGETEDHWVIVMPRAAQSLKEWMRKPGQIPADASIVLPVLVDVATALADLDGRVVHRDLKPGNVLMLDGSRCLADFGISRYAEATTAADTRKYFLSWEYAAPERWRLEHAEAACDVYALGVVAYELLAGTLPFGGPTQDRFREQHLHEVPPALTSASSLTSLVEECLLKDPRARPTPTNLLARLSRGIDPAAAEEHNLSEGLNCLASVQRDVTARRAQVDSQQSRIQTEEEQRQTLGDSAAQLFTRISESVASAIVAAAPAVKGRGTGPTSVYSWRESRCKSRQRPDWLGVPNNRFAQPSTWSQRHSST